MQAKSYFTFYVLLSYWAIIEWHVHESRIRRAKGFFLDVAAVLFSEHLELALSREQIVSFDLINRKYGVSRSVTREAISILASNGKIDLLMSPAGEILIQDAGYDGGLYSLQQLFVLLPEAFEIKLRTVETLPSD